MMADGHGSSMQDGARVAYHVAVVAGRETVFASIEYPRDRPPESIEVDGAEYVRYYVEGGEQVPVSISLAGVELKGLWETGRRRESGCET